MGFKVRYTALPDMHHNRKLISVHVILLLIESQTRTGSLLECLNEQPTFFLINHFRTTELMVSIPLRIGKKIIAHHTLLPCTGAATPTPASRKKVEFPVEVGGVVWAKGCMLPGWPGRVVSHEEREIMEPPQDKVS